MKLTTEIVRELMDYEPETGVFTWRPRAMEWFPSGRSCKIWNTRYAGKSAGSVKKNNSGYPRWDICVLGKYHRASRLAFLWMGEPLPEEVDHLNGDSLDNRWANLLASNNAENQKNRSMSRDNTSGINGVCWHKATGKWRSQVSINGKYRHLGLFDNINEAAAAASICRSSNGFTERHGQELSAYQETGA